MRPIATAAAAVLALLVPASAHAAPPDRALPPQPDPVSVVDSSCGFDVLVEGDGTVGVIDYAGPSERLIFPKSRLTLTNVATGASVSVNASGPALDTYTDDSDGGFTLTRVGTGGWVIPTGDAILWIRGRWTGTLVVEADGSTTGPVYDFGTARVVDLCDDLG